MNVLHLAAALLAALALMGCRDSKTEVAKERVETERSVDFAKPTPGPVEATPAQATPVAAVFHPLDLTNIFNRPLASYSPSQSWGMVPRGMQEFDGVPFRLECKIEVTGLGAARNNSFYPTRVTGIPVGAKAHRIHLIHGTGYADVDETPIASLVLRFANGERRAFFIEYGVHVRNWYVERGESYSELADEHSKVIWAGNTNPNGRGNGLRLFKTSFDNPLPTEPIQSLDVFSLFSRATPVLVAITVEEPGHLPIVATPAPARPPSATDDTPFRSEITFKLVDSKTGQALPRAPLAVSVTERARTYRFGSYLSDEKGEVVVDYPPGRLQSFTLLAAASNYPPRETSCLVEASGLFPTSFTLELERKDN